MKGLSFVDLHEQILQGDTNQYSIEDEHGVKKALLEAGRGDLYLWHKTIQIPGVMIDHVKLTSPDPVMIIWKKSVQYFLFLTMVM